jgi:hypothetical protein
MVVATALGAYAQPSLSDIPYIWQCNQQHISSFMAKRIGFLLLQLFFGNWDVRHTKNYAFLLIQIPKFSGTRNINSIFMHK